MSESPVGTLEKALCLHFISIMGLTCLWQLVSHVEFTASNFEDVWQFCNIVRNPNITVSNRKRDLNSHITSRRVCIFLPCLVYIPELSLIPRQVPDFNKQTRVLNGHPRCNSRIYPRFLPHLEKTHETFPSLRDEALFPCIVSRAIAFSQSNMYGASICLIELQRVPQNSVTRREEHWCNPRNAKLLGVPKIKLRWGQFPLHWLRNHPAFHIIQNKWLDFL